tara:strand:+ start:3000 stop:4892 length:1893 start_codon:yes stop_codon:yes gene_type:complete
MKNLLALILFSISTITAQVSVSDLERLSNNQLDVLRSELQNSLKPTDISNENKTSNLQQINISPKPLIKTNDFFGYNYFDKSISFFDNIPTPVDFQLGPGDNVTLSLWGETNSRENFIINKEGLIYYKNIGFINISNLTLDAAEIVLKEQLSKIYSTLDDGSTKLMLELGKLRSINVFFSGEVKNPGVNLIHPFSDVYAAIIQSGGVSDTGTLRNIQIIRSGKIIDQIDFYSFFINGKNNFSNVKLLDGDVIHIPVVKNRVQIVGEVVRPTFYELLDNDTLSDLIGFAGGLKALSSDKVIIREVTPMEIRQNNDSAKLGLISSLKESSKKTLRNGTKITILPIADNDTDVTVLGRVTFPGNYPYMNNSLKDVLDLAGGFDDPIFRKTIVDEILVMRRDENQLYSKEIKVQYADAESFPLEVNDKILVYENTNYDRNNTYRIKGEVLRPGVYPLNKSTLTLGEAINLSGGITDIGSINSISISKEIDIINEDGVKSKVQDLVGNINLNFQISDRNIITVLPKTNVVKVDGNVYSPGFIGYSTRMSMRKAIELAGGYKPNSLKRNAFVVRANGEIEQAQILRGRAKMVFPGDKIFVPVDPDPDEFDISSFISNFSSTLANIAAILIIIDRNN